MFGMKWLVDHGAMPKERLEENYASYVGGLLRTLRFGTAEAHGRAEMMEFNYLVENGALSHAAGRYRIDYARMPGRDCRAREGAVADGSQRRPGSHRSLVSEIQQHAGRVEKRARGSGR